MAAPMSQTIADYISGKEDCVATTVANEINKKNEKFLDFIECLGQPLTGSSNDTVARGRATKLIGDVLALLPPSFLSAEQTKVVATFLLAKVSDHHSVQPAALHSLAVLTNRCSPLPEGLPSQICLTIFREIQNQSLSHPDRRNNYLIFQNLLAASNKELESMGGDFVIGYIQQMDAEKDPRNLILVFSCAHHIISTISLGAFTEEMFEVLGCYFPIEFSPPPNNPHGVTKEDLIVSLRKCFAATSEFAPFCLPLLLEKISSDLQSARFDAIETLVECCPVYGRKGLTEFMGSITSALKREVLMDVSVDLVQIARDAVTAVFKAISPAQGVNSTQDEPLKASIVEMYQDVHKFLEGSNPKKACLAFSMFRAIAASSSTAFLTIIPMAMPSMIKPCTDSPQVVDLLLYLKEINSALELMSNLKVTKDEKDQLNISEKLCSLYNQLLDSNHGLNVGTEIINGITLLMKSEGLIPVEKSSSFMKALVHMGLTSDDKTLKKKVLISMRHCLQANPNLSEETIKRLEEEVSQTDSKQWAFDALSYAATGPESFNKTSSILRNILSQPLQGGVQWKGVDVVNSLGYLIENQDKGSSTITLLVQTLALPILRILVTLSPMWTEETTDKSQQFMTACKDVFRLVANKITQKDATILWKTFCLFMLEGNVSCLDCAGDIELKPLQATSHWHQTRLVASLEGFLAGVHVHSVVEYRERMFETLFSLARDSSDEYTHLSACRCAAIMMNKATLGSQLQWLLDPITNQLQELFATPGNDAGQRRGLRLWIWLTKSLECRGHSAAGIFTSKLVSLVEDPVLGKEAACGLGLVFEDQPLLFSVPLHSNITPMYKQRVFTLNLQSLMEGYEKSKLSKDIMQNYLSAFSQITSNLHQQVLKPHLDKLVSILLVSLDQLSGQFQQSTLSTLTNAVIHTPDAIVKSVDSLIPRLITTARNDPKMTVRIAALECLEKVSTLPAHIITPHQNKVVKDLAVTLGDKKRLVRMQAVETRNAWILFQEMDK